MPKVSQHVRSTAKIWIQMSVSKVYAYCKNQKKKITINRIIFQGSHQILPGNFEGHLVFNWKRIHNQRVWQPLPTEASHACCISEESYRLNFQLPALCSVVCVNPYTRLPGIILQSMEWDLPHPIRTMQLYPHLWLYSPIRAAP